jgi:hypothetical protein
MRAWVGMALVQGERNAGLPRVHREFMSQKLLTSPTLSEIEI